MQTKPELELADARPHARRRRAERHGWPCRSPSSTTAATCSLLRLDGASPASTYIAQDKARGARRRETKAYEDMINGGRTAFLSARR